MNKYGVADYKNTTNWRDNVEDNKIRGYAKIYHLGHGALTNLFDNDVIVEEKLDGSQFSFGKIGDELFCRSKGKQIILDAPDKMFQAGVEYCKSIIDKLHDGWIYRGEYLQKPKHNVLAYDRIPDNNIIIFDIDTDYEKYMTYDNKVKEADRIGLETVPILFNGKIEDFESLKKLLDNTSVLGGQPIEGFVVKNYSQFGTDGKALMGKYVREEFKEIHKKEWKKNNPSLKDIISEIGLTLKTESRWNKSIQHLKERGELDNSPKDIGGLLKEINIDVKDECSDYIKQKLFNYAWKHISRIIVSGFPQWYKDKVAIKHFEEE